MESVNYKELKDYVNLAQTDDLNTLALEYATMKEWSLLALVTEELIKRIALDKATTKNEIDRLRDSDDPSKPKAVNREITATSKREQ
jgi:hypothetical protein